MRLKQVQVLQNLEWAMLHFSNQPRQTKTIAEYIRYLVSFIFETHFPIQQEKELKRLLANLKTEDLPKAEKNSRIDPSYIMSCLHCRNSSPLKSNL